MKIRKRSTYKGFTLVELLVVMAIIATLAGISFGVLSAVTRNSYDKVTRATLKSIDDAVVRYASDHKNTSLPTGDGGEDSSIALYQVLTYDFNLDGKFDINDIGTHTVAGTSLTVYDGEEPILPNLLEDSKPRKVSSTYQILDPMGNPLRYYHDGTKGNQNQLDGGYDLWGAGEDGQTNSDSSDLGGNKDNIKNDDINNWSDA